MKYIKKYETIKNKYDCKVGDFIIGEYSAYDTFEKETLDFLNNNIGVIIEINNYQRQPIRVRYDKTIDRGNSSFPNNLNTWYFKREEILYCSDNRAELEPLLAAKKYNI